MKSILKYIIIMLLTFITLNATNTKNVSIDKEINSTKKWKLVVINKRIIEKTGGVEGKYTIYFKTKDEADKAIKKIIDKVKSSYLTMSLVVSIVFLIFQSMKINTLYSELKVIENTESIFKNDDKKEELRKKIKYEIYFGLFVIFLINIFYLFLTNNYIKQISFIITHN